MIRLVITGLALWLGAVFAAHAAEAVVPRTLYALYDSATGDMPRNTLTHRFLEMPANRLGYDIRYFDVQQELPAVPKEVKAILVWLNAGTAVPQPAPYIDWLDKAMQQGTRLVVLGNMGAGNPGKLDAASRAKLRAIHRRIGLEVDDHWQAATYSIEIAAKDPAVMEFERKLDGTLAPFFYTHAIAGATSYLTVKEQKSGKTADLAVTGPQGGYVADGYIYYLMTLGERTVSQWYLNPFEFLARSLQGEAYPIPDVTTLVGRRIFYSHIDGDGWNNITEIPPEKGMGTSSASAMQRGIIERYSDFGFTVALIAGDLTDECFGSEESRALARSVLALPNVEVASHTYTHPLRWQFFENYKPGWEAEFADDYPKWADASGKSMSGWLKKTISGSDHHHRHGPGGPNAKEAAAQPQPDEDEAERKARVVAEVRKMYKVPRSYNCMPYSDETETVGSAKVIERFAPAGKKVRLIQWPGNTSPYEAILRTLREHGMVNINGGDARFDREYPSYSTVSPIGLQVGKERQIYASGSNENTYTNLWSERFYGYRYLKETLANTESPIRVLPFNVYFHVYSAQKEASLKAVQENMDYARAQELVPIDASEFARLAGGFYTARIEPLGGRRWRIHDRGALQTLRFDHGDGLQIDTAHSSGVLGQRHEKGSLYIALNPEVEAPVVALMAKQDRPVERFLLVSSRWNILAAELKQQEARITAKGYGQGEMRWQVPQDGGYDIEIRRENELLGTQHAEAKDGMLSFTVEDIIAHEPVQLHIRPGRGKT